MSIRINEKEIPGTIIEAKRWWRKEIKSQLATLTDDYRYFASSTIRSSLVHSEAYKNARTVMLYVSTGKEVITSELLTLALKHGKRVCLPKCIDLDSNGKRIGELPLMEAREFGEGYKLEKGAYGIAEPSSSAPLVKPEEIDLVILPCVACDETGERLGHGAGYYDKYLEDVREDCKKIALCYDKTLAEKLPGESHDKKMDMVITEEKIYEKQ